MTKYLKEEKVALTYDADTVEVRLEDFTKLLGMLFNSSPDCVCKIAKMAISNEDNNFSATLKIKGNLNDLRAIAFVREYTCIGNYISCE